MRIVRIQLRLYPYGDDLTKLYNYLYLMQYLDAAVKRCQLYKKKVSLLFIDVDGFKSINSRPI
jgi:diguanylate cyclase (GGDEF)-like protein